MAVNHEEVVQRVDYGEQPHDEKDQGVNHEIAHQASIAKVIPQNLEPVRPMLPPNHEELRSNLEEDDLEDYDRRRRKSSCKTLMLILQIFMVECMLKNF